MSVRILALALGNFAVATGAYVIAGMLSDIASHTDVTVSLAGQLVTVYALTYALAAPVLSTLFGHCDRRRLLAAALVLCAAGNLLTALAPGFEALLAARVVTAIGAATFTPLAVVTAADLVAPHRRGSAVALVVTGSTLATVLGVPAGVALAGPVGPQGVYAAIALLGLAAMATLPALPRTDPLPRIPLRARFGVLRGATVPAVLGVSLLAAVSDFAVYTFVVPVLSDLGSPDPGELSALLVVYGLAGALGNVASGWATDRIGSDATMLGALVLLAAGLFALPFTGGAVVPTVAALALWGLGGWGVLPAVQAKLIDAAPAAAGSAVALNAAVMWLGMGAGGIVGGGVIEAAGTGTLAVVGGVIAVAALAPLAVAARATRRGAPAGLAAAAGWAAAPVADAGTGTGVVFATDPVPTTDATGPSVPTQEGYAPVREEVGEAAPSPVGGPAVAVGEARMAADV
ncbi:MFS transporter [Streptomonospora sp. S1-112]|uniref:MFS transporter n=1 Tax=Streptomonospora mangrovi TaxID=2883123 RepID=A0A9X3NM12_9ACTN|nr:MFS transporter [Streptomonospora mangrovi]MDA0564511.1 MFS transporter [Streptomonospora mangrovi]